MSVAELDIYLRGLEHPELRVLLSENDFEAKFSLLHKLYYGVARPILPLSIRKRLQSAVRSNVTHRQDFIWDAVVSIVKSDRESWEHFIRGLYPEDYDSAIVITHDIETQKGFNFVPKVIELEAKYGFVGSWNIVPHKYDLHVEVLDYIAETGNEVGIHGFNHDGTLYFSRKRFTKRAEKINAALERYGAEGFRSPQVHRNLSWLQDLYISYDCSCFDYDPYQPFPGGTGSIWPFMAGNFVELPYTIPQDHVLFYLLRETGIEIWRRKAQWVKENHGVILTLTHPDYLSEKNHMALYEEFLSFLREIPNAWHCLPRDMAAWYKNQRGV